MHRRKYEKIYYFFGTNLKKKGDDGKTIIYKLKFINSFRFMPTSLSNLVDNLSDVNKEECKACIKGCIDGEINKSECDFIGYENSNLRFKCKKCDRIWLKPSLSSIANSMSEITKKNAKHA